jgi:hypothetical protein
MVVTNPTWETMALSVISWPLGVTTKLIVIVKIHKYRRLHEGHHFIPMAMKVHDTPMHDMDCFIKECARIFHRKWLWGHLSLYVCIQFFRQCVNITLQHGLVFVKNWKIVLAGDAHFRPPITIKFHDLHASDIRGVVGEIISYHEKD